MGTPNSNARKASKGVTLVELAVLMLLVSLALFPIIRQMGGKTTNGPIGPAGSSVNTVNELNRVIFRETMAANDLMEKALAGNPIPGLPSNDYPASFTTLTTPVTRYDTSYGKPIYYNWQIRDMTYPFTPATWTRAPEPSTLPPASLPNGNQLYMMTVQIRRINSLSAPVVTELSAMVMRNRPGWAGMRPPTYGSGTYVSDLQTDVRRYYFNGL